MSGKPGELTHIWHPPEATQSQLLPWRVRNPCLISDKQRFQIITSSLFYRALQHLTMVPSPRPWEVKIKRGTVPVLPHNWSRKQNVVSSNELFPFPTLFPNTSPRWKHFLLFSERQSTFKLLPELAEKQIHLFLKKQTHCSSPPSFSWYQAWGCSIQRPPKH